MNSKRNSIKKRTIIISGKGVKKRRHANKVKKNIFSQNVNNPEENVSRSCSLKRLSTKTDDEVGLDESKILEERLRDLLRGNKRELRRPRNVFNNVQEDVPKLRRSVVARALQSVYSSTPMPTRDKVDFFPTEVSLNISPIDTNPEEPEENQDENIVHKDQNDPLRDINLPPSLSLPIIISDSSDENDREVQKCFVDKPIKIHNTRSQSKNNDTIKDKGYPKNRSKDYNQNMTKTSDKSSDKENTSKSKGKTIENIVQILEEKAKSCEKSKTNNRSKDNLSNRKKQNKTGSLLETDIQKPTNSTKTNNQSKNFESPSKNCTRNELNETDTKNQSQHASQRIFSCSRNTRNHTSVHSKQVQLDIVNKTVQNNYCDIQLEPIQSETTKKRNEILLSTNTCVEDLIIPLQTSPHITSLNVKTFATNTPNSKPQNTSLSTQKSLKEDEGKAFNSLQKISERKNSLNANDSVDNGKESSRRLPPRKLSFVENGNQTQNNIDTDCKVSHIQGSKKVKPTEIKVCNRNQSRNEHTTIVNKPEEKVDAKDATTYHCETSFKKNEELNFPQTHIPPKRPPRQRKIRNRKQETESDLSTTRQYPFERFANTTDSIKSANVFTNGVVETNKITEKNSKETEGNLQNTHTLEPVKKLLDKGNMTDLEKSVADIGTQISPPCKDNFCGTEKSLNSSKTVKDKMFVETGLSPITIINGNKSFDRVAKKTLVSTSTSPVSKVNKTPAYNKPENLDCVISRISERISNTPPANSTKSLEPVKKLLDKSNMTNLEKSVVDIGTQISPLCKDDVCTTEKSFNASKTVKDTMCVETGLSPITIINENKSFDKFTEKTFVSTSTSPLTKVNKTPAYNKPENDRIISRISERTYSTPKTPRITRSEIVNSIDLVPQRKFQSLYKTNLQERIHREVQTSIKKTPHKNSSKNELARKKFSQDLVEQQTQTTSSVDKMIKLYRNRKFCNDRSDSSVSEDPSVLLQDFDKGVISRNMLFQSLKEDLYPVNFSSSDEEFLNETLTHNRQNLPWRLNDDACALPRRSSLKLNFLKSAYQIEMEKEVRARLSTKYSSDTDDETDTEPPKNKLTVSQYLRKSNARAVDKVQKYSRAKQTEKFKTYSGSTMLKPADEDSAPTSPDSFWSDLQIKSHEALSENDVGEQDDNNVVVVADEHAALPIVNEMEKENLEAVKHSSKDIQSNLVIVLSNVTIKEKCIEGNSILNSSLHSVRQSKADNSNLQENDEEILAVPLPEDEVVPNAGTFTEEREAAEENRNICERTNNEVDGRQNVVSRNDESIIINSERSSGPRETRSSDRKRQSQKALGEVSTETESAKNEENTKNVSQNVQDVNVEAHTAQKNIRKSRRKTNPQRNDQSGTSQRSVRISSRNSRSQRLLQGVNAELDFTQNQTIGSSKETDLHGELVDAGSQMQSILNDRRSKSKTVSSKIDDIVSSKEPDQVNFKVPKPRKLRRKNTSEREDVSSSTTSEGNEELGVRRSGRKRKPVTGRDRFLGVIETYNQKDLLLYNVNTTWIAANGGRASVASKPRTKKKSTAKIPRSSKSNKKSKSALEQTKNTSNLPNTPQNLNSNNDINVTESSQIFTTEPENCKNAVSSTYIDTAINNNPMDDNEGNINTNNISTGNISGINRLSSISNSEMAYDFVAPQETMNNHSPSSKCLDKDSGRSTMLKSTTFDDSHLRVAKVLTGRIGKNRKTKEDFSTKISRVLSRSINQSKEMEILNLNEVPNTIMDEDKRVRKSTLVLSKREDGEFIEVTENCETKILKYVEKHHTFKMGRDGLAISNLLSNTEDKGTMGCLKLPPGTQKPLGISTKYDLYYFVIEGEALIHVKNKTSRIEKLSFFIIPWGIEYSINNLSKEMALTLGFVKIPHKAIESNKEL